MPSGLIAMGRRAFIGDDHLQEVKLPDNLERIQSETFKYCLRLRSVSFPKNLKSIEDAAFSGCPALEEVDFQNSLTNIGAYAFSQCSSLKEVTFPRSLKSLGASAFFHCSTLKGVKFFGDAPRIQGELPFDTNVVVEVLEGTKGWDDDPWRRYKITVVPSEGTSGGLTNHQK